MSGRALVGLAVAAAAVYVFAPSSSALLRTAAKPVPALCLAGVALGGERRRSASLVAAGLVFSAAGDVLLEIPGSFLAGLGAFLIAHVLYAAGFLADTRRPSLVRALPFAAWGAGLYVLLAPGFGDLALPVGLYVVAIAAMMWRAAARVGATGQPRAEWLGLAGAVLFGASDTLIAFHRFRAPLPGVRWLVIFSYWAGQTGIALSCRPDALHSRPPETGAIHSDRSSAAGENRRERGS
jgi:uncharacterized membrane protein YhhN